jgi:hypothetical protein
VSKTGPQREHRRTVGVHGQQQPGQQDTLGEETWTIIPDQEEHALAPWIPLPTQAHPQALGGEKMAQTSLSCLQTLLSWGWDHPH